jgi:hypothetical protein
LHRHGGAWLIHDRGVRAGTRGGVLRWQLAPQLTAVPLTAESVAVRNAAGAGVATIIMRGASAVRIVTREVSLRLGQRSAAQCLELALDASLEALTIVAPAGRDGTLPTLEVDGPLARAGVTWSDAAGRHRVIVGAPEEQDALQLPAGMARGAEFLWCVEGAAQVVRHAVVAAMPAFTPEVPRDARAGTNLPEESGKMLLWTNTGGHWTQLSVAQPRRG